ncbi:MAG: oligosaccharide flippase family protein, partial [Candidatus Sumerlaeota bacterium]|nr:oligosaccharide flippase family protein [Candidatus Sumerlaeota bacterium]
MADLRAFITRFRTTDFFVMLKHSKNYFLGAASTKGLALVTIYVYSRLIPPEEYGIYAVFLTYVGAAGIFLTFNSHTAVTRYALEKTNDLAEFIGASLILTGGFVLVMSGVGLLRINYFSRLIGLPPALCALLIPAALFAVLPIVYDQLLVARRRSVESSIITASRAYLVFFLAVGLILLMKEAKYRGLIWSALIVEFGIAIYCSCRLFRTIRWKFSRTHFLYICNYCYAMVPQYIAALAIAQFDRVYIKETLGDKAAGIYSMAYTVGTLPWMVIVAIEQALLPDFYKFVEAKEYDRLDRIIQKNAILIAFTILGVAIFSPEIFHVIAGKKYWPALPVVPVVMASYLFMGLLAIYSRYIGYSKKIIYYTLIQILASILNVVLNLIYIPRYGIIAGAYTTAAAHLFLLISGWLVAKVFLGFRVTPLLLVCKPAALALALIVANRYLDAIGTPYLALLGIKIV